VQWDALRGAGRRTRQSAATCQHSAQKLAEIPSRPRPGSCKRATGHAGLAHTFDLCANAAAPLADPKELLQSSNHPRARHGCCSGRRGGLFAHVGCFVLQKIRREKGICASRCRLGIKVTAFIAVGWQQVAPHRTPGTRRLPLLSCAPGAAGFQHRISPKPQVEHYKSLSRLSRPGVWDPGV
jgi:hypothetical protein